jgi:ATP-dependent RNA helicase RhlE
LNNPVSVQVAAVSAPAEMVKQVVYYVEKKDKNALLHEVLEKELIRHALVFTRTKHGADKVVKELNRKGISAEAIHGNKSQNARQKALTGFKNRSIRILVATDIASRGIDVDKLTHVINYELPEIPETYVHRIGRTGRAGESGIALSFCGSEEIDDLKNINKLLPKSIDVAETHTFPKGIQNVSRPKPNQGGRRSFGNSGGGNFKRKRY